MSHGLAARTVLNCCGRAELRRRRYQSPAGGTDAPVDDLIDLAHQAVSAGVREMCCRIAIDSGSFQRAAANLQRVGELKLSDEKLRQLVEGEGRCVLAWQEHEQLEFDFDAAKCVTQATADGQPTTRVYVGIDGFMAPMVTDAEKAKRHDKARERRKRMPRKRGVRRAPLVRRRGTDGPYKEFKLVEMHDQEQSHSLMRVTRHGPDRAARMLRGMAEDVQLHKARQVVAVTDGAEWIAGLIDRTLPKNKTTVIVDFYHAAEHVHQARRAVFGEESEEGKQWSSRAIEALLQGPWESLWNILVETRAKVRAKTKRQALDGLMQYLLKRRDKLNYARFKSSGLKIGSGKTEAGCKSESRRIKGVGMRWNPETAEAMMALESLHQSNLWSTYWKSRFKTAA